MVKSRLSQAKIPPGTSLQASSELTRVPDFPGTLLAVEQEQCSQADRTLAEQGGMHSDL